MNQDWTRGPLSRSYGSVPDTAQRQYQCPKCQRADSVKLLTNLVELMQRRRAEVMVRCSLCEGPPFTVDDANSHRKALLCRRCDVVVCPHCQRTKLTFVK